MDRSTDEVELQGARLSDNVPGAKARSEVRLPCHQLAEVRMEGEHKVGIVLDVSASGAFVCVDFGKRRPTPGSPMQLVVQTLDSAPLICAAHVAHLNATGIGVRFDRTRSDLPSKVRTSKQS